MNKIKYILAILLISLFSNVSAWETSTSNSNNWYNEVEITDDLEFRAELNERWYVEMKWSKYNMDEKMKYYKIIKSSKNSNPVYPNDWHIKYSTDINFNHFTDYKPYNGVNYYRICVITHEKNRYCSKNVQKIFMEKEEYKKTYKEKEYYKEKNEYEEKDEKKDYVKKEYIKKDNKSQISTSLRAKADKIIRSFVQRIEKKYTDNEKRVVVLKRIQNKLELLAKKKPKAKILIDYLNNQLSEQIDEYSDGFSEIEKLFNEE